MPAKPRRRRRPALLGLFLALLALKPFVLPDRTHPRGLGVFVLSPGGVWEPASASLPPSLVLLVHGLDEPGSIWDDLAPALSEQGLSVARFEYPNDGPCARSAGELLFALEYLSERGVERVDLVGHSMGGLIARDAITRGPLPLAVDHLVLVASPAGGSPMTALGALGEIREHAQRWWGGDLRALTDFSSDGRGEAAADLRVGSAYLRDLDTRHPPAGVRTTIIAPTLDLPLPPGPPALRWTLAQFGDGLVPLWSNRVAGVEDVIIVGATHRGVLRVWWPSLDPPTPPAVPIITDRLTRGSRGAGRSLEQGAQPGDRPRP